MNDSRFLNVPMLCDYIHMSKSYIYKGVSNDTIPHLKLGERTLFDKEQIDKWVLNNGKINNELPELPNL